GYPRSLLSVLRWDLRCLMEAFMILWAGTKDDDPITDVEAAVVDYQAHTGARPAEIVISRQAFTALARHQLIEERLKLTEPGTVLTPDLLAQIFDVDHVRLLGAD